MSGTTYMSECSHVDKNCKGLPASAYLEHSFFMVGPEGLGVQSSGNQDVNSVRAWRCRACLQCKIQLRRARSQLPGALQAVHSIPTS